MDKVVYEHSLNFIQRKVKFISQVESRSAIRGNVHDFSGLLTTIAADGVQ